MIQEFTMYEAERCDNGELIQGQICYGEGSAFIAYDNDFYKNLAYRNWYLETDRFFEVKSETVRRVSVKPIIKLNGANVYLPHCPNCDEVIYHDSTKHCIKCGMAIDWSVSNDKEG